MKDFLRKYGFGLILLAMFLISVSAYWNQAYSYTRSEAEMHQHEWDEQEQRTEFWNGIWENMESEFGQLFVQFLGMVAFASYVAAKQDESQEDSAYRGAKRALEELENQKSL